MDGQPDTLTRDNYDEWKHRWKRRCLPYARLTVQISLSEAEVKERINERTDEVKWYRRLIRMGGTDEMRFLGRIEGNDFALQPRYTGYQVYLWAVIKGTIKPADDGSTEVEIFVRPHLGTLVAFVLLTLPLTVPSLLMLLFGWLVAPLGAYVFWVGMSLFVAFIYKLQISRFFSDASVVPAFFSTMGEVQFEE